MSSEAKSRATKVGKKDAVESGVVSVTRALSGFNVWEIHLHLYADQLIFWQVPHRLGGLEVERCCKNTNHTRCEVFMNIYKI